MDTYSFIQEQLIALFMDTDIGMDTDNVKSKDYRTHGQPYIAASTIRQRDCNSCIFENNT